MNYGDQVGNKLTRQRENNENTTLKDIEEAVQVDYKNLTQDEKEQVIIKKKEICKKIANFYISGIDSKWYENIKNPEIKSIFEANSINDIIWEIVYKTCYIGSSFTLAVKINGFTRLFNVDGDNKIVFTFSGNKVVGYASLFYITGGTLALPYIFYGDEQNSTMNTVQLSSVELGSVETILQDKNGDVGDDFIKTIVKIAKKIESTSNNDFGLPIVWNYFNTLHESNFEEATRYLEQEVRSETQIWDDGDFSGNKLFIRENFFNKAKGKFLDYYTKIFRKPVVPLKGDDFDINSRTGTGKFLPQSGVSQIVEILQRNKWARTQSNKKSFYFINSNSKGSAQQHSLEIAMENIDAYIFQKKINETITNNITFLCKTIDETFNEKIDLKYKNFVLELLNLIDANNMESNKKSSVAPLNGKEKDNNESK